MGYKLQIVQMSQITDYTNKFQVVRKIRTIL